MPHPRVSIRNAVKGILNGNTSANTNVYSNRTNALSADKLPALNIRTVNEDVELFNEAKRTYKRTLSIIIIVADRQNDDIDDTLDNFCQEIEDLIFQNETLSDTVSDIHLDNSSMTIDLGDKSIGATGMLFKAVYYTDHQIEFDDLERAQITLKAGSESDTHNITTINIPTE